MNNKWRLHKKRTSVNLPETSWSCREHPHPAESRGGGCSGTQQIGPADPLGDLRWPPLYHRPVLSSVKPCNEPHSSYFRMCGRHLNSMELHCFNWVPERHKKTYHFHLCSYKIQPDFQLEYFRLRSLRLSVRSKSWCPGQIPV